ncbi:phosphoglucomutase/phosphomannomutase family protein [Ruminococcaceae bacterium OttesenSCG-928-D13]|nr:phosphoglucomutase/phosphomannomutase family protein [Ruminococcaceae bacterium OttesenSCG-928-D13]
MVKFGTGGWRAIIGDGFTKANLQLLTTAIIRKLKDDGLADAGFVIGYDRRFLSEEAARWAAEVVAGEGVHCRIINRASPTPLIMYAVNLYGIPYGMAITASHNPAIYNGVKVFMSGGRDADEELTAEFEGYIGELGPEDVRLVPYEDALAAGTIELVDPMNQYIDSILKTVDTEAIRSAALYVAMDPMFGVSKTALQTILLTCRCEVDMIHERRDALFGGRLPAPSQETLAPLITHMRENHCDIGLATDGDADRLGVIDDEAQFLHPNKILVLLYYYLLKYKGWRGAAVRNLATTHLLDRIAEDFGETCYEVPVGFKYVSSKMVETGAIIGGESSGGLTVRGHIQGKDGIYAGTLLVEMLAKSGRKLSDLWRDIEEKYGRCEMVERDYHFTEEKKAEMYRTLLADKLLPEFPHEVDHVSYLDGCKVYFKNGGWVIARFSGTEPLLRIFAEMDSQWEASLAADTLEHFLGL